MSYTITGSEIASISDINHHFQRPLRAQIARGPLQYQPPFSYETCRVWGHRIEAEENRGMK